MLNSGGPFMKSPEIIPAALTAPEWVGADPASVRLRSAAARLAQTHSTLLVRGESGTGKNLFAEIVHYVGPNRDQPLLKIDCATLPEGLIESELFGHEKGAFTGAAAAKVGLARRLALAVDPRSAGALAGCSRHSPAARITPCGQRA